VVVGGHCRGVGKTTAIERVLRASAPLTWTAVKISAHRHAPDRSGGLLIEEGTSGSPDTQTGRYLAAGARQAWLVHATDPMLRLAAHFVSGLLAGGTDIIVESNRILGHIEPATAVFVLHSPFGDWKPSSEDAVRGAHAFLLRPDEPDAVRRLPIFDGRLAGRPVFEFRPDGPPGPFEMWLQQRHPGLRIRPIPLPARPALPAPAARA
jgi:hypothetical protein